MMLDYRVDIQLIEAINRGDIHAFNTLMMRYQLQVARVVARYSKNPNDIMDITQEVFMKIYQSIHTFRGESAFYTWLYRIAVNTAKNHIMKQSRRLPYLNLNMDEPEKEKFLLKNSIKEQET